MNELGKALDIYLHKFDHILLTGEFISEISERSFLKFCMSIIYNVYQTHIPVLKILKTNTALH